MSLCGPENVCVVSMPVSGSISLYLKTHARTHTHTHTQNLSQGGSKQVDLPRVALTLTHMTSDAQQRGFSVFVFCASIWMDGKDSMKGFPFVILSPLTS